MDKGNERVPLWIKYVQGKYNYVADQLSQPVRIVQCCPTTTILGLTSEEFIKCQREEVKWREMTEYLEGAQFQQRNTTKPSWNSLL